MSPSPVRHAAYTSKKTVGHIKSGSSDGLVANCPNRPMDSHIFVSQNGKRQLCLVLDLFRLLSGTRYDKQHFRILISNFRVVLYEGREEFLISDVVGISSEEQYQVAAATVVIKADLLALRGRQRKIPHHMSATRIAGRRREFGAAYLCLQHEQAFLLCRYTIYYHYSRTLPRLPLITG